VKIKVGVAEYLMVTVEVVVSKVTVTAAVMVAVLMAAIVVHLQQ